MANYHLEIKIISRGNGGSVTHSVSYICGKSLYDCYRDRNYNYSRIDVLYSQIYLPSNVPPEFGNLQILCNKFEEAEIRYDARTARTFICSLPNELPVSEQIKIVSEFIQENFTSQGLCSIAAIHEGRNKNDPEKNNPHVHVIVSTRAADEKGFNKKKDRLHNDKKYTLIWREAWAKVQNRAYERNGLDIRVSHESLEVQGEHDRKPVIHLSQRDWQKEQRGERTAAGDRKRAIQNRNKEKALNRQRELERTLEINLSR